MDNFIIYIATAILLIVFIFLLPGIALFPKFIFNPRTAAAIPFISISVIVSTQYLLRILGQFYQANLIIFLLFVSLIASFRLFKIFKIPKNFNNYWKRNDLLALFLIFLSCIPLMVILGFDGFQHADEIMSWNLWAKKIFFNEETISTGAAYPLLLPSLIAFCYKFIGNIEYQLPIRFTFSLIYISTIYIVFSFAETKVKVGIFFLSYLLVFLIIGVGFEYKKVWADTLMSGFLVASLALLFSLSKTHNNLIKSISPITIFLASMILICAASLTKQGAIIWTMIIYPLIAYVIITKNKTLSNLLKLTLIFPILTPILWFFIGGSNFHTNTGVLNRSFGGRGYLEQLEFGFIESFVSEGRFILLIFMIIVFTVLLKKINLEKAILAIGISLSTIFLIFFGAYETTRLYLHIILAGWLILFVYGDQILASKIGERISILGNNIFTYLLIGILFIFWSINSFNYRIEITDSVSNFLDGREVQLNWVVGASGPKQYRQILDSNLGLWAKDSHIWGIYYGIENFHRGELGNNNQDLEYILNEIKTQNIGWVYLNEEKDIDEIDRIQGYCNDSLNKIETSKNMYKQVLYEINLKKIHSCIATNKIQ